MGHLGYPLDGIYMCIYVYIYIINIFIFYRVWLSFFVWFDDCFCLISALWFVSSKTVVLFELLAAAFAHALLVGDKNNQGRSQKLYMFSIVLGVFFFFSIALLKLYATHVNFNISLHKATPQAGLHSHNLLYFEFSATTPPKFNIAPEKWWLEDYFPIGKVTFQGLC